MSRWISKHPGYNLVAHAGTNTIVRDNNGASHYVTTQQPIVIQFQHERILPAHDRLTAINHWIANSARRRDGSIDAFGAYPDPYGGEAISDGLGRTVGYTDELRPDERFSVYDFDIHFHGTPEEREIAEHMLRTCDENGRLYIEVQPERLPPPWPAYLTIKNPGKVAELVHDLGLEPQRVIDYELSLETPRRAVVAELEKLIVRQAAALAETRALTSETA